MSLAPLENYSGAKFLDVVPDSRPEILRRASGRSAVRLTSAPIIGGAISIDVDTKRWRGVGQNMQDAQSSDL